MAKQYLPGGLAEAAYILRGKLSTAISKGINCYYLVGSIPMSLTHEKRSGYSLIHASNTWPTLEEAIDAVKGAGITRFQLPDCTWYQE